MGSSAMLPVLLCSLPLLQKKQGNKDNESFKVVYECNSNSAIACIGT